MSGANSKESSPPPKRLEGDSSIVSSGDIDRNSSEYKGIAEKFDKFGEKLDVKSLEEKAKQLDNKFKILADFAQEGENSGCDMMLFKNVYMIVY